MFPPCQEIGFLSILSMFDLGSGQEVKCGPESMAHAVQTQKRVGQMFAAK